MVKIFQDAGAPLRSWSGTVGQALHPYLGTLG